MEDLLSDSVAVVTGGSSGNGRAIARLFAAEGADVVVGDVREEPRLADRPTHEVIEAETDARATFVETDVTDPDAAEALMAAAEGFGSLDVLVNNAGVVGPQGPLSEMSETDYRRVMGVNLDGVVHCTRAAVPRLEASGGGSVVNLSSAAGLVGFGGTAAYSAAKGGVRLLTYALADELGPEIRVNAIAPGIIETAMTTEDMPVVGSGAEATLLEDIPLDRFGTPEDVAKVALFLASDLSSYVSATTINLDGGELNTV